MKNCVSRIEKDGKAQVEKARWIEAPFQGSAWFRNELQLDKELDCEIVFAAIPSFKTTLDGKLVERSSMQHSREQVFCEPFRIRLSPGSHTLEVLVVDYQGQAPLSRVARKSGFFCAGFDEESTRLFASGVAKWTCRKETRFSFLPQRIPDFQCASGVLVADFKNEAPLELFEARMAEPGADAWTFKQTDVDSRRLSPAPLPPFKRVPIKNVKIRHCDSLPGDAPHLAANNETFAEPFAIPANATRRILLELDNYHCADFELAVSGGFGAEIKISWAESLFLSLEKGGKGNREEIEGRFFIGLCDVFKPGPAAESRFFNMDYRAGRCIELLVQTAGKPLKIESFELFESRYPLSWDGFIETGDKLVGKAGERAFRTLQMCAHDTFMDCPYYEQLMYLGDGRLQLLTAYVTSRDLRLVDHAMLLWGEGLRNEGLFVSLYPARTSQIIPAFSIIYILMLADYVRWRNKPEVVERVFPLAVRSLLALESMIGDDGIFRIERGWLFVDWAKGWDKGIPPMKNGASCIFNALCLHALEQFAETCEALEEPELAARFARKADALRASVVKTFYRESAKAFSDLPDEDVFSEHANALALLSKKLPANIAEAVSTSLFESRVKMTQATVYFSYYVMEAAALRKNADAFFARLKTWFDMEPLGLKTLLESPEPSRSDCHAWSSHVLFHLFASVAGLKPDRPGGASFKCEPLLGPLTSLKGSMPAGDADIVFEIERKNGEIVKSVKRKPAV